MQSKKDAVRYTMNMQCPLLLELTDLVMKLRSVGYVGISKSVIIKASAYHIAKQARSGSFKRIENIIDEYLSSEVCTPNATRRDING